MSCRMHHWSIGALIALGLTTACSKKNSGGGGTSAPQEAPPPPTPLGEEGPIEGDNDTTGSLRLNLSQPAKAFGSGVSGTYNITNVAPLPSVEAAFNGALPDGMVTGSLALSGAQLTGMQLTSGSVDGCSLPGNGSSLTLLPPSANLRALDATNEANARADLLGDCRVGMTDAAASACDNLIQGDQWKNVSVTHNYQNGIWDRFFDGCGPTDIRAALKSIDTDLFDRINRLRENGSFRCVELPGIHKKFSARITGAAFSDALGVADYPFACTEEINGNLIAYGKDDNHFYTWDTATNGAIIKVSHDGKKMDIFRSLGDSSLAESDQLSGSSIGGYRLVSEEDAQGKKTMRMSVLGNGIGPDCGGYIASVKNNADDVGLIYFELRNQASGSPATTWSQWKDRCTAGQTRTYCLRGDLSLVASATATTLTACTDAGLTTPPAGFEKFAFDAVDNVSVVTPAMVSAVNLTPVPSSANPGIDFSNLVPSSSIVDPMKVLMDRIFGTNVASAVDVEELVADANLKVQNFLKKQNNDNPQCVYETPKSFNHMGTNTFETGSALLLSCVFSGGATGLNGDETHVYISEDSGERMAVKSDENRISVWKYTGDESRKADPWTNDVAQATYTRLLVETDEDDVVTQEVMMVGDNHRFRDIGCGIHYRRVGNRILVQGKFADHNCETAVLDNDCLQLSANGSSFSRLELSECRGDEVGDPFTFATLLRENIQPSTIITLASLNLDSSLMSDSVPRAEDGEAPATEMPAPVAEPVLSLTAIDSFPLVAKTKYFAKVATDGAPYGVNCLHAGAGTHSRATTGTYRILLSNLPAADLASLNTSVAAGTAYVAVEINRVTNTLVGTVAAPSIAADLSAKVLEGTTEVRKINSPGHAAGGLHLLAGFEGITFGSDHVIEISWTGTATIGCPTNANSQAQAAFNLNGAPKLRFN